MVPFLTALILFLLIIMCVFLICLVLIQRGKGGGLAGAFGGVGGSSAFGTKAGDVFTKVTMITAGIWIVMNMVLVILSNERTSAWGDTPTAGSANKSAFSSPADKAAPTDKAAPAIPGQKNLGAADGADALAPPNFNAPAASPLGSGPVIPGPTSVPAAPPAAKSELPDSVFQPEPAAPVTPTPVGSTLSGGGANPKP